MKPNNKMLQNLMKSGILSRIFQVVLVIGLIILTIYLSGPLPQKDAMGNILPSPTPTLMVASKPVDLFEITPTTGVIVASLGVILIILIGTAIAIRRQGR
jgi:hypothetical protein